MKGTRAASESEAALSQRGAAGAAARGRGRRRPRQAVLALSSPGRSSRRPRGCGHPAAAGAAGDAGPEAGAARTGGAPHGGRCAPLPRCPGGRDRSCRIPANL